MRGSRTTTLIIAGALGFGALVGLAGPASADTPPFQPGVEIAQPDDEPGGPDDKAPVPTPGDPVPHPDLPLEQPLPGGDPEPEPDLPLANPQGGDDEPDPEIPPGPGDVTSDPGCNLTHGCEPETPDGHCFDDAGNVVDVSECLPDEGDEPGSSTEDRGSLPRTGAGLVGLAAAGLGLIGGGTAARKAARR